jgi:hypothetical protein
LDHVHCLEFFKNISNPGYFNQQVKGRKSTISCEVMKDLDAKKCSKQQRYAKEGIKIEKYSTKIDRKPQ